MFLAIKNSRHTPFKTGSKDGSHQNALKGSSDRENNGFNQFLGSISSRSHRNLTRASHPLFLKMGSNDGVCQNNVKGSSNSEINGLNRFLGSMSSRNHCNLTRDLHPSSLKGSVSTHIGHMELGTWDCRADFSELIHSCIYPA